MDSCTVQLPPPPGQTDSTDVRLICSDFNRLRWVLGALRVHPALAARVAAAGRHSCMLESLCLQRDPSLLPASGPIFVVLWDGLNSLIELWHLLPELQQRPELCYVYVGQLPDIHSDLPANSLPLFPLTQATGRSSTPATLTVPLRVLARTLARRWMRPALNLVQQGQSHRRLARGGLLVFCGVVRPSQMVLDDVFRGPVLPQLRQHMNTLDGLDWAQKPQHTQALIRQAYEHLQNAHAQRGAEWACLFTMLNILHRLGTLSALHGLTDKLYVNEFLVHRHFDPYDAQAYRGNLYLDFGSTRGTEQLYPRMLDLQDTGKRAVSLRLLAPGESVQHHLQHHSADHFLARCQQDAQTCLAQLRSLVR
jgi:hypothetical protein